MRVLITGAAGFVAAHLADHLREMEPDAELFGITRSAADRAPGRMTLVEADLLDADAVQAALELAQPDRIVHLAAQSSPRLSWDDPEGTLRTNVIGTLHLLEAARRCRTPPRTLLVGSAEEYGLVTASDGPLREDAPLRPNSPYAVSKLSQSYLGLEYALVYGLPVVRTRTFHHTGPGRGETFAEASFARQILEIEQGRRPPVLSVGNLDARRDYTDVRDVVRAYWALLDHGERGEVYNVCSGHAVRIRELLDVLLEVSGVRAEVRVESERLRPSDAPVLVGDCTRLRNATGWEPRIPLERTLKDLLAAARQRESGGPAR